jgi:hypothetical protein
MFTTADDEASADLLTTLSESYLLPPFTRPKKAKKIVNRVSLRRRPMSNPAIETKIWDLTF